MNIPVVCVNFLKLYLFIFYINFYMFLQNYVINKTAPNKMLAAMILFEIVTRKFYRVTNKHYFAQKHCFFNGI